MFGLFEKLDFYLIPRIKKTSEYPLSCRRDSCGDIFVRNVEVKFVILTRILALLIKAYRKKEGKIKINK